MVLDPGNKRGIYEVIAPNGTGGVGEVYRAQDKNLGRASILTSSGAFNL